MTDLVGRVVVITGGNGGIGLGMAHGVAAAGAAVAVWGRDEAKNDAAVEALRTQGIAADLLHARFAMCDRLSIERDAVARFGRDGLFARQGSRRGGELGLALRRDRVEITGHAVTVLRGVLTL